MNRRSFLTTLLASPAALVTHKSAVTLDGWEFRYDSARSTIYGNKITGPIVVRIEERDKA